MNEIKVLTNKEVFGFDFNIYGTGDEPLFLAKDIAEWIEHSNPRMMLNGVDEEEKLKLTMNVAGQKDQWFLTENGVMSVLANSRKYKSKFNKEFTMHKKIVKQLEFEHCLKKAIEAHLEGFDWEYCPFNNKEDNFLTYDKALYYETEYKIPNTNYRVDFYFPKFNLIVEYDEEEHKKQIKEDERRKNKICNILSDKYNCHTDFIRVKEGEEFEGIIKIITTLSRRFVN